MAVNYVGIWGQLFKEELRLTLAGSTLNLLLWFVHFCMFINLKKSKERKTAMKTPVDADKVSEDIFQNL